MENICKYRYVRSSAQKIRLVANQIRNKNVSQAMNYLNFSNRKSAFFLKKALKSAISNIRQNSKININDMKIKKITVDNGPSMKRIMPRAKGRADRILKRTSHITIVL